MKRLFAIRVLVCCCALFFFLAASAQIKTSQVDSLLREGQEFLERGDFRAAAKILEQARRLAPENKLAWHSLILVYLQSQQQAEALDVSSQAAGRWPDDGEFRHQHGQAFFMSGKNEQAIEELQRAAKLDPRNYEIHFDLALVYLNTRQYVAAAQSLGTALRRIPAHPAGARGMQS